MAILLLLELAIVMYYVSRLVLIVLIVIVVLSFLSGAFGGVLYSFGCLSSLLQIPIQVIGAILRPIAGVFDPGRDARNMRQVREYRLNLTAGSQDVFVVKGNLDRCTLDAQDEVRVHVANRQGRPYLQRGELLDKSTGAWLPLHVSEPPLGMYWLLGFLVVTAILVYVGFTLQLWHVPG